MQNRRKNQSGRATAYYVGVTGYICLL